MNQVPKFLSHEIDSPRHKILGNLLLILVVVIPLFVISVFALRSLQTEALVAEKQATSNNNWVIESIDRELQLYIEQELKTYFSDFELLLKSNSYYRGWIFKQSGVDLLATYTKDGLRTFPSNSQNALFNESIFLQQIRTEVSLMFNKSGLPTVHRAIINDVDGPKFLACNAINQIVVCFLFNTGVVKEWITKALANISTPRQFQTKLFIPEINQSFAHTSFVTPTQTNELSLLATKSMSGIFAQWEINLFGIKPATNTNQLLLLGAILLIVFLFLISCGYGLYKIGRLRSKLAVEQKQFSAELAHEVRTPLTNIRLYVDLIQQSSSQEQTLYCSVITSEIDRLSLLVGNTMLLAYPEKNLSNNNFQRAGPDELINTTLDTMMPLFKENSCSTIVELNIKKHVCFDHSALQRVLINLFDNACKYAEGGRIQVISYLEHSRIIIELKDDGPGLPKSLWEKAQSISGERINSGGKGFGLGLRVCLRLCRRSGGQLQLLSTTKGTHYKIYLPITETFEETSYEH